MRMEYKREFVEIISMKWLFTIHCELAYTTHWDTWESIIADKFAEERFCTEKISYLKSIERLPSLTQQGLLYTLPGYWSW